MIGGIGASFATPEEDEQVAKQGSPRSPNGPVHARGVTASRLTVPALKEGAILTDVGSVKQAVIRDLGPHVPPGVHFVPGHPVAGTEHSGPESGFAELFAGRWCILIPLPEAAAEAVTGVATMWARVGMRALAP